MSELIETPPPEAAPGPDDVRYLIGIRLREPLPAEDYLLAEADLHVGDFCVV
ncbi:MAG TPA: hypothetical protein VFT95_06405 [Micromonosporaceae bacterium]|nr:hypothetical protein [Micromonosporaceae bacterium]